MAPPLLLLLPRVPDIRASSSVPSPFSGEGGEGPKGDTCARGRLVGRGGSTDLCVPLQSTVCSWSARPSPSRVGVGRSYILRRSVCLCIVYIFSLYQLANRWPPRPPPLLFSRAGFGGACVASFVGRVVCLLWFRPYPLGGLHMLAFLNIVGESEDILGVSGFQVCSSARLRCPGALRALCSECGSGSLSSPPRRGVGLASCVASLGGWRGGGRRLLPSLF